MFIKAEIKAIKGKKFKNTLLLFLIVFISLNSLGFGKAMLSYLKQRMDSPFVQFVDVNIPIGDFSYLLDELSSSNQMKRFNYDKPYPIYTDFKNLIGSNGSVINTYCRKVDKDDQLISFITESEELLLYKAGSFKNFHNEFACIATTDLLEKLGHTNSIPTHITILISIAQNEEISIPIPLKGVVTNLPDNVELLVGSPLFDVLKYGEPGTFDKLLSPEEPSKYIIVGNKINETLIKEQVLYDNVKKNKNYIEITAYDRLTDNKLKELQDINGIDTVFRTYNYDIISGLNNSTGQIFDYITFPFKALDSIPAFAKYLTTYGRKVDMSTIEAKENFRIFNNVGNVLSSALMIMSIMLITLFSSNIILAHIDKNKKNLGTLKAFGLSNGQIVKIYTAVSTLFISTVFISAYLLTILASPQILNLLVDQVFQMNLGKTNTTYFISIDLISGMGLFVLAPVTLVSLNVYRHIKGQTPGDLIYERD